MGQTRRADRQAWRERTVGETDPYLQHFSDLAHDLDMAIAVTYLERWPEGPRNTMLLIDRFGRSVLKYAKVHTCDFSMEALLTPGDDFPVGELDTAAGPVSIGAMICYDREFPESARILMLNGAEIILVPNTWDMNDILFTEDGHAVDPTVVEADESEGIWIAPFDLDELRRYRERETWGTHSASPRRMAGWWMNG